MTEPNPDCPYCGEETETTITYEYGHKTADGWACEDDDCPGDWWGFMDAIYNDDATVRELPRHEDERSVWKERDDS